MPDDFFKFNSSFYKFFADKKNWIEARGVCEEHKGDLVSFVSPAETTFVFQTMLHGKYITNQTVTMLDESHGQVSFIQHAADVAFFLLPSWATF